MGDFSVLWALLIVAITYAVYKIIKPFVRGKKNKMVWLVSIISVCVYSGIGIAYSSIKKGYLWEFTIYIVVLGIFFAFFSSVSFCRGGGSIYAYIRPEYEETMERDAYFWDADLVKKVFIAMFILYFILRFGSLVYPVNKLSGISITYSAVNNLKNISGENANILNSLASYIKPMAYIGMFYAFKRVRYVAVFLGLDLLVTLLYTGYLSRSYIICALFIVLMLFFNNDLSDTYISLSEKKRRIFLTLGILGPVVLYMMIYLMTIRTQNQSNWTIMSFFSSEIDYPKHYEAIRSMEGEIISPKDMMLHILDSFVPFVPTPEYTGNLNVLFSEHISGVSMILSWFSVLLPSILGEAMLVFGRYFFWCHAIIIAFMLSMITRITKDNPKMSILFYYYLTCVMKAARGGYAELSSTVMFNIIMMCLFILILRAVNSTIER